MPLYERFPALRDVRRALLCALPSPVERIVGISDASDLWIKRDDLSAPVCGGNKVRSLEFLLGNVKPGDTVLTLGGEGSTHVLSTALHASRLGASTVAMRWRHDMNTVADLVSERLGHELNDSRIARLPLTALMRCGYVRLTRTVHFIPMGGSSALGALGHVNAGLELAAQIEEGAMPMPQRIVLPLGTGGTMAGLALGLSIAGLNIPVIGARVGPRLFAHLRKVRRIANSARRLIARRTGELPSRIRRGNLRILHDAYGGAYGRPLAAAAEAAATLHRVSGIRLDDTYSAKAFAAALDQARTQKGGGPTLFWLTFDARCLTS